MKYTLDQVSKLLGKSPRTLYRLHIEHGIGKVQDVAEGRRLLFTNEEFKRLEYLLRDKSRERLLADPRVLDIITTLIDRPMTLYDLTRTTGYRKSTITTLITTMTPVFWELSEDQRGVLYWDTYVEYKHEGEMIRHVYLSSFTNKVVFVHTYSDIVSAPDRGYTLLSTDRCAYVEDSMGKLIYSNDILLVNGEVVIATEDFKGFGKIIGNIYEE